MYPAPLPTCNVPVPILLSPSGCQAEYAPNSWYWHCLAPASEDRRHRGSALPYPTSRPPGCERTWQPSSKGSDRYRTHPVDINRAELLQREHVAQAKLAAGRMVAEPVNVLAPPKDLVLVHGMPPDFTRLPSERRRRWFRQHQRSRTAPQIRLQSVGRGRARRPVDPPSACRRLIASYCPLPSDEQPAAVTALPSMLSVPFRCCPVGSAEDQKLVRPPAQNLLRPRWPFRCPPAADPQDAFVESVTVEPPEIFNVAAPFTPAVIV